MSTNVNNSRTLVSSDVKELNIKRPSKKSYFNLRAIDLKCKTPPRFHAKWWTGAGSIADVKDTFTDAKKFLAAVARSKFPAEHKGTAKAFLEIVKQAEALDSLNADERKFVAYQVDRICSRIWRRADADAQASVAAAARWDAISKTEPKQEAVTVLYLTEEDEAAMEAKR